MEHVTPRSRPIGVTSVDPATLTTASTRLAGQPLAPDKRPDGSTESCPCRPTLDRLSDRWSAEVIAVLEEGPLCAGQLQRRLEGISRKVLTATLRGMERDGLVSREVLPDRVVRVQYRLTALGLELVGPLSVIRDWSQRFLPEIARAQHAYDTTQRPPSVTALRERPSSARRDSPADQRSPDRRVQQVPAGAVHRKEGARATVDR